MSNAPLIDFSRTPRILRAVGRRSGYQPSAGDLAREAAIKALGSRIEAAIAYGARHPEQEAHCRSQARHMAQESARLVARRDPAYVRHLEALRGL